jgi:hypothetical protein
LPGNASIWLRRLRASDDDTATERREMLSAKDALVSGQTGFGDHHLTLLVRAPSLVELNGAVAHAASVLADVGAIAVREDVNLEPAFWAQFPGNEAYIVRRALISASNAAGFLSLHGFPQGQMEGNHWGPAISLFETSSATPYFFNFHAGDLGHFSVIGPSGSGKTVVLNFLTAQAQKLRPRTVFFDKDRGRKSLSVLWAVIMPSWNPERPRASIRCNCPTARPTGRFWPPGWAHCFSLPIIRKSSRSLPPSMSPMIMTSPSAACVISANCLPGTGALRRAIWRRDCGPGSRMGLTPGCSTIPPTRSILAGACWVST